MADQLDRRAARTRSSEGGIGETISVIVQALLIALVIRTFLFQPFNIPSGSLIPTLLVGDYLFVSKYAYGYSKHSFPFSPPLFSGRVLGSDPKRGDIIVFKLPADNETDYIKRLVGLPGDRIQMIDGVLHINGKAVKKERVGDYLVNDGFTRPQPVPMYRETNPEGVSYNVIEASGDSSIFDNTREYVVPPNHYFMMGDNRDNSLDSRDMSSGGVGYVPYENLVGRGEIIFFSFDYGRVLRYDSANRPVFEYSAWQIWNWPTQIRFSRFFMPVK